MTNPFVFDNPGLIEGYDRGTRWFIPGYDASHVMAATLIHDRIGERGRVLVLGAGGGVEITALGQALPGCSFVGVDPFEPMLAMADKKLRAARMEDRVELVRGYIPDAPAGPFDAATCFFTLHLIPDDGTRLDAMKHVRRRLTAGAPFLMTNFCADKTSPAFERQLRLYRAFALRSGAPADMVAINAAGIRDHGHVLPPEREEALLCEAGFGDVELFYIGLNFRGWIASAASAV